jgi:hypothetical protein
MALLPAHCDSCGLSFVTPNFIGGTGTVERLVIGDAEIPCPRCNGPAKVQKGVYTLVNDVIRIITTPNARAETLRALAEALEKAKERGASADEVKATIKEQGWADLADIVPTTKEQRYQFLMVVLTAIAVVLGAGALVVQIFKGEGITEQQRKEITDDAVRRVMAETANQQASPTKNRAQRRAERSAKARRRK